MIGSVYNGYGKSHTYLFKGFYNDFTSLTSEDISSPSLSQGVMSVINGQDTAALSSISALDTGSISVIEQNLGTISFISNQDTGISSTIDGNPTGAESEIS